MAKARLETAGAGSPSGFLLISTSCMDHSLDIPSDEAQNRGDEEDRTESTKDIRDPSEIIRSCPISKSWTLEVGLT